MVKIVFQDELKGYAQSLELLTIMLLCDTVMLDVFFDRILNKGSLFLPQNKSIQYMQKNKKAALINHKTEQVTAD